MISRLAAALLLSVAFATSTFVVCLAKETDGANGSAPSASASVGKKLKRVSFSKDKFSVLLPGDYTTVEKTDVRTYMCTDYPHGMISVMCATAADDAGFSPTILKQLVEKLTPNKKSIDQESTIKVNGVEGTQWDITNNVDTPHDACQVRGFIVGRKLYIVMVYGTKPWIKSDAIAQLMDSIEITSE